MATTLGHAMLQQALPEGIDISGMTLDKKNLTRILEQVQREAPDKYREVLARMMEVGRLGAYSEGVSVNLRSLSETPRRDAIVQQLQRRIKTIRSSNLSESMQEKQILDEINKAAGPLKDAVMKDQSEAGSPYAEQVNSGARGKPAQLVSLVGGDLLYQDHNNDVIPVPVLSSYSEGLDPTEYWAGTYGARRGLADVKFATADAGFYSKRLINAAHRMVVTDEEPIKHRHPVGLPTTADDSDNVGAVLANDIAGYSAGTTITAAILKDIRRKAPNKRFLVHSPLTSVTSRGGIDRYAAGVRDKGTLATIGTNVGIPAAQSVSERVSQGVLNSKHAGGAAGTDVVERAGFQFLNRLIEAPESFPEAGVVAPIDGRVRAVDEAPQGGWYVTVNEDRVFIPSVRKPAVKPGQEVEAGDRLSDGIPHPVDLVKHKGLGEGRRLFTEIFVEGLRNSGINTNRRNAELIAAGLINHVKVNDIDGIGNYVIDDIVPYGNLFGQGYEPRQGAQIRAVKQAQNAYLEEPVLHYTPGTRITKSVMKDLNEFGVRDVNVHDDPPTFEPHFVRGMLNLYHDPDWMTQLGGFYTGKAFQESARRGAVSQGSGSTSFYGALASGGTFGRDLSRSGTY